MTFTVFSLRDSNQELVYIGVTTLAVEKRLQDMMKGARCKQAAQYNQKVSQWLRHQYETFQTPGYRVEGTFRTRPEANALKSELMNANIDLLNVNQPMGFREV